TAEGWSGSRSTRAVPVVVATGSVGRSAARPPPRRRVGVGGAEGPEGRREVRRAMCPPYGGGRPPPAGRSGRALTGSNGCSIVEQEVRGVERSRREGSGRRAGRRPSAARPGGRRTGRGRARGG